MRRRYFSALAGGTVLASLDGWPAAAAPPDGCSAPPAQADGWAIPSSDDGNPIDSGALCRMADELTASSNMHFSGPDEVPGLFYGSRVKHVAFSADTLHDVKSVSKSVASLVIGIAIDRG